LEQAHSISARIAAFSASARAGGSRAEELGEPFRPRLLPSHGNSFPAR
jgi:hypothetical protein